MDSNTFHKTPLSFWLFIALAVLIAEACVIYLAAGASTSSYTQPGRATSLQATEYYSTTTAQY